MVETSENVTVQPNISSQINSLISKSADFDVIPVSATQAINFYQ